MSEVGTPEAAKKDKEAKETPLYEFYFRVLVSVAAASTLVSHLTWGQYDFPFFFFFFLIIYPVIAYGITKKFIYALNHVTRTMAIVDAVLLGTLVHIIDFSLLPAILFLTIIVCQALITGGPAKCVEDILAYVFGLLSAFVYYDSHFKPLGDLYGSLPSLIGISFYFIYYSLTIYNRIVDVRAQGVALHTEQQDLKMKLWNLSRYVSPQVWKMIFSGHAVKLETKRKQMTIFFSDIKGFSELSEQLDPSELNEILSEYLTEMSNIVHKYGGTIDKFIGDAIMVFYGDPSTKGLKQDCVACVSMAIEMKRKMKDLQLKWQSSGISMPLEIRMGINTGYCTVGNFGTQQRLDYTVIGTEVNLASRLESVAPPGEILISQPSYDLIKDNIMCRDTGLVKVKGFAQPVQTFQVTDFRQNLGNSQTYFDHRTDGFSLYMDMEKIKNYDREKVLKMLLVIATKLKSKIP